MKTTYALIGAPLDGLPLPSTPLPRIPFDPLVAEIGEKSCLLDFTKRCRFVRLSDLPSCNTQSEVDSLNFQLTSCEEIYILLDFSPHCSNTTITRFYGERSLQIARYVSDRIPEGTVFYMESPEHLLLRKPTRLTLPWLIRIAESYIEVTARAGMAFDAEGFPLIPRSAYACTIPSDMVDWPHRGARYALNPRNTAICFFMGDSTIYPRFEKLLDEAESYRRYAAVVMPDITVTADMDPSWQSFIMLLNHLFGAVLTTQGVKLIANTRCGSKDSRRHLKAIPKRVLCASGSLGCANTSSSCDYSYAEKIFSMNPSFLLTYGKRDQIAIEQLTTMGTPVAAYPDSHARKSKSRAICHDGRDFPVSIS